MLMLSYLQANVYSRVQDPDTFLKEPKDEADYNTWLETYDLESKQVEMADLLVSCKPLHKHFSMLVPTQVRINDGLLPPLMVKLTINLYTCC